MTRISPAPPPHELLSVAEVDMTPLGSETRAVVAFSRVPAPESGWTAAPVAALTWDPTSAAVEIVYVIPEYRRQHLATLLWNATTTLEPDLGHSRDRSPTGTTWAMRMGGVLPPIEVDRDDKDAERLGARLLEALWGFESDQVLAVLREPGPSLL